MWKVKDGKLPDEVGGGISPCGEAGHMIFIYYRILSVSLLSERICQARDYRLEMHLLQQANNTTNRQKGRRGVVLEG